MSDRLIGERGNKVTNHDDDMPVGDIRKVQSMFWIGDLVRHRCAQEGDPQFGIVLEVSFRSGGGINYLVQWTIGTTDSHAEIELEGAVP